MATARALENFALAAADDAVPMALAGRVTPLIAGGVKKGAGGMPAGPS